MLMRWFFYCIDHFPYICKINPDVLFFEAPPRTSIQGAPLKIPFTLRRGGTCLPTSPHLDQIAGSYFPTAGCDKSHVTQTCPHVLFSSISHGKSTLLDTINNIETFYLYFNLKIYQHPTNLSTSRYYV